jgi:hypothetical protein
MSLPPRFIQQPGPVNPERIVAVEARGRAFSFDLPAGVLMLEGVRQGFAAQGFTSGVVELEGLRLGPFGYVTPALSKDGKNAAFYSEIYRPSGVTEVGRAALTFGSRDGQPFFHCHGLWREADGKISGGHMLPEETIVAAPCRANALGLSGAGFVAELDPEINFKVFGPVPVPGQTAGQAETRVIALRPRPNQDFHSVIATVCAAHGMQRARIRGGVGSTIGCVFEDGRVMPNFATEVYIERGIVDGDHIEIDIGMIDYTGAMATGRLKRGANPVLMTFELVLESF